MELLLLLQEIRNPILDILNFFFTKLGEETVIVLIMCTLYWCVNKKYAYKMGFAYFASAAVIQSMKVICRVPRPWLMDSSIKPVEGAVEKATGYSFPSGHTQSATATYGTIAWNSRKNIIKISMFIIICAVAFSRMYLGVHSPLDVASSMLITILITFGINYVVDSGMIYKFEKDTLVAIMLVVPLIVMVLGVIRLATGSVDLTNSEDLFKAVGAGIGFSLGWYLESNVIDFDETKGNKVQKVTRLIIGLLSLVGIKTGLKALFVYPNLEKHSNWILVSYVLIYGFIMFWAVFIYPYIFTKVSAVIEKRQK